MARRASRPQGRASLAPARRTEADRRRQKAGAGSHEAARLRCRSRRSPSSLSHNAPTVPTVARSFIAVLAISAAITTTKGTVEIAYPPYLAGYGYTLSLIGFLTALIAVLQLISRLPVGVAYHADRVKWQFALACVAFAASTSGFAFAAGQPLAVAALSVLHGFAFGSLGTLGLALAIDVSVGRRVGVSMAWYTAANSTGYAVGALIGGSLADTIGIPSSLGLLRLLPA